MTQQPFSRPGAIDLSGLKQRASAPPAGSAGRGAPAGAPAGGTGGSAYSVDVTEANFQEIAESSMTAPVVLVCYAGSRSAESETYARSVATLADAYDGRFLVGLVDIDNAPQIAQALQIQQVPLMLVLLDGRPVTQPIPGAMTEEELNTFFQQLGQQLTAQGVTGRHQPRSGAPAPEAEDAEESGSDPRFAAAETALENNQIDIAVAEYERLVSANPADAEAAAGLAMARVLQRTQGVDLNAARDAAAADRDDLDAQTLVADLDLLGGHVEDAFTRLVDLIRRTTDKERDQVREHLLGLFAAVGNDDDRVLKGRQQLASALF